MVLERWDTKNQANFRRLIDIIGHPSFIPADVIHHGWTCINTVLAENQDSGEWVDAADEGWQLKQIEIHVPFHSDTDHPGPRLYHGINLYHRSLIAVMKERVSDSSYFRHFHIEPYKLLWKSPSDQQSPEIRIHGELYTSQLFLRAHDDLQKSESSLHSPTYSYRTPTGLLDSYWILLGLQQISYWLITIQIWYPSLLES